MGKGSAFHFTTVLGIADQVERAEIDDTSLAGIRTLIVDDNATNRRILVEMFSSWRMSPTAVGSAREGLDLMRSAARREQAFSLVVTDIHMPERRMASRIRRVHQTLAGNRGRNRADAHLWWRSAATLNVAAPSVSPRI